MDRRKFVKNTVLSSMAVSAMPAFGLTGNIAQPARNYRIGIMWGTIGTSTDIGEKFKHAKEAGFNGVQVNSHLDRNEVMKASKATGLPISSVCDSKHWEWLLSSPDKAINMLQLGNQRKIPRSIHRPRRARDTVSLLVMRNREDRRFICSAGFEAKAPAGRR